MFTYAQLASAAGGRGGDVGVDGVGRSGGIVERASAHSLSLQQIHYWAIYKVNIIWPFGRRACDSIDPDSFFYHTFIIITSRLTDLVTAHMPLLAGRGTCSTSALPLGCSGIALLYCRRPVLGILTGTSWCGVSTNTHVWSFNQVLTQTAMLLIRVWASNIEFRRSTKACMFILHVGCNLRSNTQWTVALS